MSNLTRRDPLDDFFRGFFVRPVEYGSTATTEALQMRVDVKEIGDAYQVHAELPERRQHRIDRKCDRCGQKRHQRGEFENRNAGGRRRCVRVGHAQPFRVAQNHIRLRAENQCAVQHIAVQKCATTPQRSRR